MPDRVVFTPACIALLLRLRAEHGPLLFHLSGGCCEGSAPMCLRQSDFNVGPRDVLLGVVEGCPFYVGPAQFSYWDNCQLTIDITSNGGDSFSLEAAEGVRFIVRSRLFTEAETALLEAPPTGADAAATVLHEMRPG
jgi:uncharacterized protein